MGSAIRRLQKRNKARKSLAELMENSDHVLVIHYSCESFMIEKMVPLQELLPLLSEILPRVKQNRFLFTK